MLLKAADEKNHGGSWAAESHPRSSATSVWGTGTGCAAVSRGIFKQHLLMKMFTTDRRIASCVPGLERTVDDMRCATITVTEKELSLGQLWALERLCGSGLSETSFAPSLLREKQELLPLEDCRTGNGDYPQEHMYLQLLFSEIFFQNVFSSLHWSLLSLKLSLTVSAVPLPHLASSIHCLLPPQWKTSR